MHKLVILIFNKLDDGKLWIGKNKYDNKWQLEGKGKYARRKFRKLVSLLISGILAIKWNVSYHKWRQQIKGEKIAFNLSRQNLPLQDNSLCMYAR